MKLLLLTISTAILGLGAAHINDKLSAQPCDGQDCEIRVECTPQGTCLVTCICPDGTSCTREIECPDDRGCEQASATCKPADCKPR